MDSRKRNIVIALMLAMFLGAVEGTVVTTAVPTIVRDLQGFDIISLVFSAYLLTSAISTPICGKLSDLYGRKNVLSIGIVVFLVGSFLCGLAQSIHMLIAFRAIQGLGAGAIFTVTYTIVGDAFTIDERAKVQGGISTVWGIASLAGPLLGGVLIDTLSWHWVFFINIPFGILSVILLQKNLTESFEKKKHRIDYLGIITLSAAMIVFLNIFLSGTGAGLNRVLFTGISLAMTLLLLLAFCIIEKKAEEPTIPFNIFTKTSTIVNLISFLASAILIGVDVYLPVYIQNILGFNATVSGLALAPMSVFWLLSSVLLGKRIIKYGGKAIILLSSAVLLASTVLLPTLGINSSLLLILIIVSIMGFGFGGAFATLTIVIQESVDYSQRGAATAANSLLRSLGQTIGVSAFGSVFNLFIVKYFMKIGISGVDPSNLYKSSSHSAAVTAEQIRLALNSSLHVLFIILIVISGLSLILSMVMPKISFRDET